MVLIKVEEKEKSIRDYHSPLPVEKNPIEKRSVDVSEDTID